jgi:sugar-specific transcriptional regulator TrmB
MKIYKTIEHMTWSVEAIEGVRNAANERAAKLPAKDSLRSQLEQLAKKCDELRSKIVATKEGGMITGEERIRELLGQVYGAVNGYEGRPADYQAARADSLAHELEDVINDFQKLTQKNLAGINAGLKKKKLEAIPVLAESDWEKKRASEAASTAMQTTGNQMQEMD